MGIRCPNCGKLLAASLEGTLVILCRQCQVYVTIKRPVLTKV